MIDAKTLLRINVHIAALSFVGFWLLDWPLEVLPGLGIAWVLTSSLDTLSKIFLRRK